MDEHTVTLEQVLTLARRLSARERALLIARIAEDLAADDVTTTHQPFPVLHGGEWPCDMLLNRENLYDDRSR